MYTYTQLFIGIPLSQFHNELIPIKSKDFIEDLGFIMEIEQDIEGFINKDYEHEGNDYESTSFFLKKLQSLKSENSEFQEFCLEHEVGFHSNYHGGDDAPLIFGFYIDKLLPIPDMGLGPFSIDLVKINQLQDTFRRFLHLLLDEKTFKNLDEDKLIGVFYNNHSS